MLTRAYYYLINGEEDNAFRIFQNYMALHPSDMHSASKIMSAYLELGLFDKAINIFNDLDKTQKIPIQIRITGNALVMTKKATSLIAIMLNVINTDAAIMTLDKIPGLNRLKASNIISVIIIPANGFNRWASASI